MDIITNSSERIGKVETEASLMENRLLKKLDIISDTQEYILSETASLKEDTEKKNDGEYIILPFEEALAGGTYERYGLTVHPAFLKEPVNVFNFRTADGWIYKNSASVSINGTHKGSYNSMLMHDSVPGKENSYERFLRENIILEVEMEESSLLGGIETNAVEILPLIAGSFTLNSIEIYTMEDYRTKSYSGSFFMENNIKNCPAVRIFLGRTVKLYKAVLDITVNFKNSGGAYPFGLKHLYFLKTNINPDSHAVFKVEKDSWINTVGEDIVIKGQNGKRDSSCSKEGIKLYSSYSDGELSYEIETGRGSELNPLSRNIKSFYVKMPLKESIFSLKLNHVKTA